MRPKLTSLALFLAACWSLCSRSLPAGGGQPKDAPNNKATARRLAPDLPYYFQAERLMHQTAARHTSDRGDSKKGPRRKWARRLRVVTIEAPPFMMKRQRGEQLDEGPSWDDGASSTGNSSDQVEWHGYCMDFFHELLKYLPYELSYEIYEVPDQRFGSKTREILPEPSGGGRNSSQGFIRREYWNGMIGELASGRAQLALAPMSVMAERELVVDFTVPFYDLVGIQILLKRPEVPRDWFKFLTVLDNEVWLSITIAYFITSLVIYLFDRFSPYSHKNTKRVERIRAKRRQLRSASRAMMMTEAMESVKQVNWMDPPTSARLNKFARQQANSTIFHPAPLQTHSSGAIPTLAGNSNLQPLAKLSELPDQQVAAAGRRRLSQDYLQSLRLRHLGANGFAGPSEQPAKLQGTAATNQRSSLEESDSDSDSSLDDGRPDFNLRDSLWFCITSLTPQGGGEAPQNLSGRVVAGAWWLFCFIVIASYTANLAAFLTVSRLDIPIESLDDLAKQYRIKYAPIEGTAEQSFFERMAHIEEIFYNIWKEMSLNDSLSEEERSRFAIWDYPISDKYTKIWSQIQEVQMPSNLSQAIERVKASTLEDGFALLANANIIRYATMTDCQFRAVGEEFSRKPIALALEKNQEELRDDLSYAILQLINKRYMEVLREKWWTNNPSRLVCDLNDESEGISIENIGGVFIIILAGVLLSFLVWAIERLLYSTKLDVSREMLLANHQSASKAT